MDIGYDLSTDISDRDRTGTQKTFSGLMKILYPHQEATRAEVEELLRFAMEGRKRVKDQLLRIDSTYASVQFSYSSTDGRTIQARTLEEELYPRHYRGSASAEVADSEDLEPLPTPSASNANTMAIAAPEEKHLVFQENQRGVTFEALFGPYLKGAHRITVTDPYIRLFYQARNLMELLETIARQKPEDEEVAVHLITVEDDFKGEQQVGYLEQMMASAAPIGIVFSWEFDHTGALHARHIVTDHGWKILLDRGLDIFQHYEMNDAFAFSNRLQQFRACKAFEVTYLKTNDLQ